MKARKNNLLTLAFAAISLAAIIIPIAAPSITWATSNPVKSNVFVPTILAGPLIVCTGTGTPASTRSDGTTVPAIPACQDLCDLVAQIANVIYFMIAVVIWIVVPISVAVGGIMIMIAGANPGMIEQGKKTITGAVIGLVIVLCAWLIVFTFVGAFGNLGKYVGGFGGANGKAACAIASPSSPNPSAGSNP